MVEPCVRTTETRGRYGSETSRDDDRATRAAKIRLDAIILSCSGSAIHSSRARSASSTDRFHASRRTAGECEMAGTTLRENMKPRSGAWLGRKMNGSRLASRWSRSQGACIGSDGRSVCGTSSERRCLASGDNLPSIDAICGSMGILSAPPLSGFAAVVGLGRKYAEARVVRVAVI